MFTTEALLVVICSPPVPARQVIREFGRYDYLSLVAIDFSPNASELLLLDTSCFPEAVYGRLSDLSGKRNLGLLLARMLGWSSLLFQDDDIGLLGAQVQDGLELLADYSAVGYPIGGYPDCSVISHAARIIYGGRRVDEVQGPFVSGSALLIDPSAQPLPFFPNIYNEDWLFLYDWFRTNRVAVMESEAIQITYDPFASEDRAIGEEFGELVAWGMEWLFAHGSGPEGADKKFWTDYLGKRRDIIKKLLVDLSRNSSLGQVIEARLKAAERRRREITPESLAKYVTLWRSDLEEWDRRLALLPRVETVHEALLHLGQQPVYLHQGEAHFREAGKLSVRRSTRSFEPTILSHRSGHPDGYGPSSSGRGIRGGR